MEFLTALDRSSLLLLQDWFGCSFLDFLMPLITFLGNWAVIWFVFFYLIFKDKQQRNTAFTILFALLLSFLIANLFMKNFFARERPYIADPSIKLLIPPSAELFSFPSGHASSSFAAASVMMMRQSRFRYIALLLAILISFSRLYLMMHYPLDVAVGTAIGFLCGFIACTITAIYESDLKFRK